MSIHTWWGGGRVSGVETAGARVRTCPLLLVAYWRDESLRARMQPRANGAGGGGAKGRRCARAYFILYMFLILCARRSWAVNVTKSNPG